MRKNVFGRQFKRDANERKALFKALLSSLVLHKKIKTTEEKAKAIKGQADKLITKVKRNGENILAARKLVSPYLIPAAIDTLIIEIVPHFAGRSGGYTRIIRLGKRFNDDATMVVMEWVGINSEYKVQNAELKKIKKTKKNEEKQEETVEKAATSSKKAAKPEKKATEKKEKPKKEKK